jgi:hypothetical protein
METSASPEYDRAENRKAAGPGRAGLPVIFPRKTFRRRAALHDSSAPRHLTQSVSIAYREIIDAHTT